MTTLLTRRQRVFIALEGTPGTPETLAAEDGAFFQQDTSFEPEIEFFDVDPYNDALGTEPGDVGTVKATVRTTSQLVGSGSLSTAPPFDVALRACGMGVTSGLTRLTIGAISGGPYLIDETVTGGTSSATGTVCMTTRTGATYLYVVPVSGTFQSGEVITGGTSSATASTTAGPTTPGGRMYSPISSGFEYATVGHYKPASTGGQAKRGIISYSLGNVVLRLERARRCFMDFAWTGRMTSSEVANLVPDAAPQVQPPQFKAAGLAKLLNAFAPVINSMEFDLGHEIETEPNANDATGLGPTDIIRRASTATADPRDELPSVHDYFALLIANTTGDLTVQIGASDGNRFFIHAPRAQYSAVEDGGDRAGRITNRVNLTLHRYGSGNNELRIIAG